VYTLFVPYQKIHPFCQTKKIKIPMSNLVLILQLAKQPYHNCKKKQTSTVQNLMIEIKLNCLFPYKGEQKEEPQIPIKLHILNKLRQLIK
jgi:hypothetical protein